MLLVQISDIHCGPMFDSRTFRTAAKEINALSPDVVVVTGDLTEDGIRSQFQQAEQELKRLKAKDVIYVSGNHDYRATRYLLFQQLFPFHQITEIEDTAIIVLSSARPDRDDGEVGHRQNLWRARQALHLIDRNGLSIVKNSSSYSSYAKYFRSKGFILYPVPMLTMKDSKSVTICDQSTARDRMKSAYSG